MAGKIVEKDATVKVARQRLSVLEMAETLGNISEACRRGGMDRTSFYEWKRRFQTHGLEGLKDMPPIPKSQPNQTTPENEAKVIKCSLAHPSWGCVKLSDFLKLQGVSVSSPTIQKILIRNGLASVYDRWLKVEERHLEAGVELTAEQVAKIEKYNPCFKERHVESSRPGELLSQDTFMVGNLKGIGTVYLHACVDTYGSYAFGFLHTGKKPECAAALVHNDVLPFYKEHRPSWSELVELVEAGNVATVIVKDMSRLGRDYLKVGFYTEVLFVEKGVRFIAISNGIDSSNQQDNDFTPFLNIINEFFVRDTSKKIKAVMKNKGEAGDHLCTIPPYGLIKDPDNKKRWIVDEEAAEAVRRIFNLCLEGYGPSQIARILENDKVLVPSAYWNAKGIPCPSRPPAISYRWVASTVSDILEKRDYLGHTVNFKTYKQSYKSKKKLYNPEDKHKVFEDTHEAIVDVNTWERAQELRRNKRRPTRTGKTNMFSGLVSCANII